MHPIDRRSFLVAALASGLAGRAAAATPEPLELVKRADDFRQIYHDSVMSVKLTQWSGAEQTGESRMRVAIQGTEASLIRVAQGVDAGQQMLMLKAGLWVKLPRSSRTVRITPMQRLLGQASVGDIGRMRWQDDYAARYADTPETTVGGVAAWQLDLTALSDLATYPRVLAAVAKSDGRPLEASFFLKSGKAIKAVRFGPVEKINDRQGIRRMEFRDLLKEDQRTELAIEQVEPKVLEPRLYALESLGEWQ